MIQGLVRGVGAGIAERQHVRRRNEASMSPLMQIAGKTRVA
jgi:hypothetical protein